MKNRFVVASLFITLFSTFVFAQTKDMTNLFSENVLRAHVKFLSDDLLEGRGPGTRGGELAARYIAAQMEIMGLKGAGANGSYFQPVSLVGVKADPNTTLNFSGSGKSETFKFADEFVAFTGAQTDNISIDADTIFVGYGIDAPEQKWNDYKGNAADYRGKVLVMMVNDPPATAQEPNLFGGKALTYYGRWTYKFEQAARMGAAGVILIHTDESAGYPWSVVRTSNGSWRYDIERTPEDATPYLQMRSWVTNDAAKRLFAAAGKDLDALREQAKSRNFQPVNLGLRTKINLKSELKKVNSANVVGTIEGSDPKLKDEYVVYSAHYDHLGVGAPNKNGDTIYNGAVDNATGVASVLAIAEAIQKMPVKPKRSSLFLIPTAEEQGLLGADWYSKHPIFPVEKTAADVNLDSVTVLGRVKNFSALGVERSSLKSIVEEVARERGLTLVPDARPEQGSFYRSDHFPFARVGVPSLNMEAGDDFVGRPAGWGEEQFKFYNANNYHQPSDEYKDSFDFSGTVQMAELSLAIGLKAANAPKLQAYNSTDEFAKAQPNRK
ncbi:MAG: M28 family peptidase [Acidobacteriota bacterium]|nr:M28 family peptidase [Acidobacteriota bacterium]